jgi:hypothetical protein
MKVTKHWILLLWLASAACAESFEFQNNFWVNLHHFVRGEARRRSVGLTLNLPPAELNDKERPVWTKALDAYASLAKEDLVFSEPLVRINKALATMSGDSLPPGVVDPKIAAALESAAPIYRAHLWDRHRRANAEWIEKYAPIARQHSASVTKALAAAYRVSWPTQPILVDVACEAGPNLAYTTGGPPGTAGHTVIAASQVSDPDVAFETVFHEASHTVDDEIVKYVDREAESQHVKAPPELWHAVIFYTVGEIVRRERGKQNDPAYKTYADRAGVYNRGEWPKLHAALQRDWQPYLDGKATFEDALHKLVRDATQ